MLRTNDTDALHTLALALTGREVAGKSQILTVIVMPLDWPALEALAMLLLHSAAAYLVQVC